MANILVFSNVPLWTIHYAEAVEICLDKLGDGNTVHLLSCSGSLQTCPANPNHSDVLCKDCIKQTRWARDKILSNKCIDICLTRLESIEAQIKLDQENFESLEDLNKYKYFDLPAGELVASDLVDRYRDSFLSLTGKQDNIKRLLINCIALYEYSREVLEEYKIDIAYVWNGRRGSDGPVIHAARALGIKAFAYISGPVESSYIMMEAPYVQDLSENKKRINLAIKDISQSNFSTVSYEADKFFSKQRFGTHTYAGSASFSDSHKRKLDISYCKPILTIFTSSYWEFYGMSDYKSGTYENHYDGVKRIVSDLSILDSWSCHVRWHPNLCNCGPDEKIAIETIIRNSHDSITHYPSNSDVDSYDLLDKSDAVITFGSTLGVEATYYGKPSILLGRALYEDLDVCHKPTNHDSLVKLLLSDDIRPLPRRGSLLFGYSQMNPSASYFRHLNHKGGWDFAYNGINLKYPDRTIIDRVKKAIKHILLPLT
jgi:hypothetical protein